jgi:hypothetical protein
MVFTNIEEYKNKRATDLLLCESLIPLQKNLSLSNYCHG